ncbi:MAG: hypothetical protein JWQ09_3673 [Segetibacter sp.]|nr:hypothetical protein [Segetibacter sp.]
MFMQVFCCFFTQLIYRKGAALIIKVVSKIVALVRNLKYANLH